MAVRVPSKSELQCFAHWLPAAEMRGVLDDLLKTAANDPQQFGLAEALDLDAYFLDSTCLKANIHFPTDWVLLRDGVRTLMKATVLIRQAGLRGRMQAPETFLRQMNRLSIAMTQLSRRAGKKKGRKQVLRQMKPLTKEVRNQARRHRDLLDQRWRQTELTQGQASQILRRVDGVLELLPKAVRQAHERIIGARPVANAEKTLSLYDPEVRVMVRGKAGAEVEFGNTVLLGGKPAGHHSGLSDSPGKRPGRQPTALWKPAAGVGSHRETCRGGGHRSGFASATNSRTLKEGGTFDGLCPRQPAELSRRMHSAKFAGLQCGRAQTEGRIGILKHGFLGQPLRAKGFEHRELALACGVLTHNLWRLARLRKIKKKPRALAQAE